MSPAGGGTTTGREVDTVEALVMAEEVVVQEGRAVADAQESAGRGVLNADPCLVPVLWLNGVVVRVCGATFVELRVDPATLVTGGVDLPVVEQVDPLRLEEHVEIVRSLATRRAARAGEHVLVVVVRERDELVLVVVETRVRRSAPEEPVAEVIRGGTGREAVGAGVVIGVAPPHQNPGLKAVRLVAEIAEAVTFAETLSAVTREREVRGDVSAASVGAAMNGINLVRAGYPCFEVDELAEEGLQDGERELEIQKRAELERDRLVAADVAAL